MILSIYGRRNPGLALSLTCLVVTVLVSLALPTAQGQETKEIGMRILVLSTGTDTSSLSTVKMVLESMAIPYTVVSLTDGNSITVTSNLGQAANLMESDGTPRYMGVILTSTSMLWSIGGVDQGTALTLAVSAEIDSYCIQHGVRRVDFFSYPSSTYGVTAPTSPPPSSRTVQLEYTTVARQLALHLNTSTPIPIAGNYIAGAVATSPSTVSPVFRVSPDGTIASAIVTYKGYEVFQLYHSTSSFDIGSVMVGPVWVNWLTRGIYIGAKLVVLDDHIDDTFLRSVMYDPVTKAQDQARTYRITYDEMKLTAEWTWQKRAQLPRGSTFLLVHAFNGFGIEIHGGPSSDPLFKAAMDFMSDYLWVSHTFTHLNLDAVTYEQAQFETVENQKIADNLLFTEPKRKKYFSEQSMVTPQISGLFNGAALSALRDHGIIYVIGDNSVPELVSPNPYHGIHTTTERHGATGVFIIPRFATEVFFDCTHPDQNVAQYNNRPDTPAEPLTFFQLMDQEAKRATRFLMSFRHDGYMFHQANLNWVKYQGEFNSLITWWNDWVFLEYLKYSKLPVMTNNIDEAAALWLGREQRDACQPQGRLVRTRSAPEAPWYVSSIRLSRRDGNYPCVVKVTGARLGSVHSITELKEVKYGPEFQVHADLSNVTSIEIPFVEPVLAGDSDLLWRTQSAPARSVVSGLTGASTQFYTSFDNTATIESYKSDGTRRIVGGDDFIVTMTYVDSAANANGTLTGGPGGGRGGSGGNGRSRVVGRIVTAYYLDKQTGKYQRDDHSAAQISSGMTYGRLLENQQRLLQSQGSGEGSDGANKRSAEIKFTYDIIDDNSGTYKVLFNANTVGLYDLRIYLGDTEINGSPFRVLLKGRPPFITKVIATDPENNVNYADGDVIEVHWDVPTNQPDVDSKEKLDNLFTFSQNIGLDYSGRWSRNGTLLEIVVVDSLGATPPSVGNFTVTPKGVAPFQITKAAILEDSYPATRTSPAMIGDFGHGCKMCLLWLAIGLGVGIPLVLVLLLCLIKAIRARKNKVGVNDEYDPDAGEKVYLKQIRTDGLTQVDFYGNSHHADFTSVHF